MTKQIEKRTAEQRREYFKQYHAAKRLTAKIAPNIPRATKQRIRTAEPPTLAEMRAAWAVRAQYEAERGGAWPVWRHLFPESLDETLRRRVK